MCSDQYLACHQARVGRTCSRGLLPHEHDIRVKWQCHTFELHSCSQRGGHNGNNSYMFLFSYTQKHAQHWYWWNAWYQEMSDKTKMLLWGSKHSGIFAVSFFFCARVFKVGAWELETDATSTSSSSKMMMSSLSSGILVVELVMGAGVDLVASFYMEGVLVSFYSLQSLRTSARDWASSRADSSGSSLTLKNDSNTLHKSVVAVPQIVALINFNASLRNCKLHVLRTPDSCRICIACNNTRVICWFNFAFEWFFA